MGKITKAISQGEFREAAAALWLRTRIGIAAGKAFDGKRDYYKALGYKKDLEPQDFRDRYLRDEVAGRIVDCFPDATWRGGPEVIEDEDPDTVTAFEQAFIDMNLKLDVWFMLKTVDRLAQLGHYAVLFMGAEGEVIKPLERATELKYLAVYAEDDAQIQEIEQNAQDPRFGQPITYMLRRTAAKNQQKINTVALKTHHTRIVHIIDGQMDDVVYGTPRLERIWNRLDDLWKVVGGGSEAFWRRVEGGKQFDIDPAIDFGNGSQAEDAESKEKEAMRQQIEEYEHGFRRYLTTRGVKINDLGSDVADFASQVNSILSLISAGIGIPQRVLMGSEQGKLAAKQDRANWDNRVQDRQRDWAEPKCARKFIDRQIELGTLPKPAKGYHIRWSSIVTMDDEQRATIAGEWASLNTKAGAIVVVPDEIRERILQLGPLADQDTSGIQQMPQQGQDPLTAARSKLRAAKLANLREKGGRSASQKIQDAADRFRSGGGRVVRGSFRRGALEPGRGSAGEGVRSGQRAASAGADRRRDRPERPVIASVVPGGSTGDDR